MKYLRSLATGCLLAAWLFASAFAQVEPISGAAFDQLAAAQQLDLQRELRARFPDSQGYLVTGPFAPASHPLLSHVRVICADHETWHEAVKSLDADSLWHTWVSGPDGLEGTGWWPVWYIGALCRAPSQNPLGPLFLLLTHSHNLWYIWARDSLRSLDRTPTVINIPGPHLDTPLKQYAQQVASYLGFLERGDAEVNEPHAVDYDLDESLDLYAPHADYVIQGYANYKAYLREHADIDTDFAHGILGFIPTDSLLHAFKANAPHMAFPNKEQAALQHEFKKFFDRGGDMRTMHTLTAETFASLQTGEYFWGMNVAGQIRFGRELLREEVERIEAETGRKAPRANHAFLFPGEPLLTAGAFWIEADPEPRLAEITAGSGHYFYSNIQPTIREDIAQRSNEYIWTLGHFFGALDALGIAFDNVLIRKY